MRFRTETPDSNRRYSFIAHLVEPPIWYLSERTMQEIRDWCCQQNVNCTHVHSKFFFKTEADRLLFMLRWSE